MRKANREKQLAIDFSAEPPGDWGESQLALKEMLLHSYTQKL
jgi:hypothetical protein